MCRLARKTVAALAVLLGITSVVLQRPVSYLALVWGLGLVAVVLVSVRAVLTAPAPRRWLALAAAALGVAAAGIGAYGRVSLHYHVRDDVRRRWRQQVQPDHLRAVLRVGMTPAEVAQAMEVSRSVVTDAKRLLVHGIRHDTALETMGVSTDLVRAPGDSDHSYLVWCHPVCPYLGCCDGAVLLRFAGGRLDRVEIHGPMDELEHASEDVARYEKGGRVWHRPVGDRSAPIVRFSPTKTLEAIRTLESEGLTVLGGR